MPLTHLLFAAFFMHIRPAHQSYSHRVQSVTMSNWAMDEVEILEHRNGGGT